MTTLQTNSNTLASPHRFALVFFAVVIMVFVIATAGAVHANRLNHAATGNALTVFPPAFTSEDAFAAIVKAGGRPIRPTWLEFIWVAEADEPGFVGRLEAGGALGAYAELPFSPQLAGCIAYVDAKVTNLLDLRP